MSVTSHAVGKYRIVSGFCAKKRKMKITITLKVTFVDIKAH